MSCQWFRHALKRQVEWFAFRPPRVSTVNPIPLICSTPFIPLTLYFKDDPEEKVAKTVALFINCDVPNRPTIIYCHGNASTITDEYDEAKHFATTFSVNMLLVEYAGYPSSSTTPPLSQVTPSETLANASLLAAYEYLISQQHIDPTSILLMGHSLGSGPVTWLAARLGTRFGGLVLLAPLASVLRVPFAPILRHSLSWDIFDNVQQIAHVQCPTLIIRCTMDDMMGNYHPHMLAVNATRSETTLLSQMWPHHNVMTAVSLLPTSRATVAHFIAKTTTTAPIASSAECSTN